MKTLLAILMLGATLAADAAKVGGVELPTSRDELSLRGAGLLRKGFFFKIYVGALYVGENVENDRMLTDVPKRIDIHYFHHTPKRYMLRAAEKTLAKNLSPDRLALHRENIDQLHEAFLNGEKGRHASIIHEPGAGLLYCFDGHPVARVGCDDFANAYFSIWLGERPSSRTMKKAMLDL